MMTFYAAHPFWIWIGIAAALLVMELPTATGWLLWPSACAGLMALFKLTGVDLGWPGDVVLYAVATIAATLIGRRFLPRKLHTGPDINDRTSQLLGKTGLTVAAFEKGAGRVIVDGAEWEAEAEGEPLPVGARVEVVKVLGGARLSVRPV